MYVLENARLVYLANPKTATQSVRAMLDPYAGATPQQTRNKHINMRMYLGRWLVPLVGQLGFVPQTCAVMRAPMAHMKSWYLYRRRPALRGHENSTYGIDFAEFVAARLRDPQPPYAHVGRQDLFLGYHKGRPLVEYIFDYERLDLLVDFLSERLGVPLELPRRNLSDTGGELVDFYLPPELLARYEAHHADEIALYDQVKAAGVLHTPP